MIAWIYFAFSYLILREQVGFLCKLFGRLISIETTNYPLKQNRPTKIGMQCDWRNIIILYHQIEYLRSEFSTTSFSIGPQNELVKADY